MASASRRNGALWACVLVVLATTPSPGTSEGESATFVVDPIALYLNHDRYHAPFSLTCSHPPGATGGTKKLEVLRKNHSSLTSDFELLAEVVEGEAKATQQGWFHVTGNSDELRLKIDQGDCLQDQFLYQCRSTIDSVTRHKDLRIQTFAIPKAKATATPTAGGQMSAGVSYTFRCEALGLSAPELKWYVFEHERFIDLSPEMFSVKSFTIKSSPCLITAISMFSAEGEEVNQKLKTCNFQVKCEALPQGTPDVGGNPYNDIFNDTFMFQLQTSVCNSSMPIPDQVDEPRGVKPLYMILASATIVLLLMCLVIGVRLYTTRRERKRLSVQAWVASRRPSKSILRTQPPQDDTGPESSNDSAIPSDGSAAGSSSESTIPSDGSAAGSSSESAIPFDGSAESEAADLESAVDA